MFMEEMTRKQPDVDKVTKTYKRKPAEASSSLAERRGARKSPFFRLYWTKILSLQFMKALSVSVGVGVGVSLCFSNLWWNWIYVCLLQANSSSRRPCRSLGGTLDSTSCVAGGSRFGYWLLTASANSMMLWTDSRRYNAKNKPIHLFSV